MGRHGLALGLVALLLAGCVGNRAYHSGIEVHDEALLLRQFDPLQTQHGTGVFPYHLCFVEFDDRGELFKRDQLVTALAEIASARAAARASGTRAIVAVFVHGWKNNASPSSGNVWGFRQVLANLSAQFGKPPVVGIYIGWRGAVVSAPILKEFTFFDRRRKSQSLPNAQMTEVLLKIMRGAKGPTYQDPESAISVLVGHSFGGAVLETALTDSLMHAVVDAGSGPVRWPADLVVFINEAQEAIRSYQLIEAMHKNLPAAPPCTRPGEKGTGRVPEVVSISSKGDYATRALYPATQAVIRPFNSLRAYTSEDPNFLGFDSQSPMFFNTTAHTARIQSHLMGRADDPEIAEAARQCAPVVEVPIGGVHYTIVEKPGALNRTPYWVMQMPASVVPDHSTIFTPVFTALLTVFILNATIR